MLQKKTFFSTPLTRDSQATSYGCGAAGNHQWSFEVGSGSLSSPCLSSDMNVSPSLSQKMQRNRTLWARVRRPDWLIDFRLSLESICKWLAPLVSRFWRKLLVWEKSQKNLIFGAPHQNEGKKHIYLYYFNEGIAGHLVWVWSCGQPLVTIEVGLGSRSSRCLSSRMNVSPSSPPKRHQNAEKS